MDVSFISATLLLAPVFAAAPALTEAVILVKPQFEAGRGNVGKGGIVRDPEVHKLAVEKVADVHYRPRLACRRNHPLAHHRQRRQHRISPLREANPTLTTDH